MLKQRVITALVLLLILLPALFHPDTRYWRLVTLLLIAAAAWEWGRLNGLGQFGAWIGAFVCLVACVMAWDLGLLATPQPLLWTLAGGALGAGRRGAAQGRRGPLGHFAARPCACPVACWPCG